MSGRGLDLFLLTVFCSCSYATRTTACSTHQFRTHKLCHSTALNFDSLTYHFITNRISGSINVVTLYEGTVTHA